MDSWRRASSISGFPCLFLLICSSLLLHAPSSSSTSRISLATSSSESEKVSLVLYYESLCPYCSNFIVNELVNIFDNGLISIIDLNLVPYGNAKLGPNDTIACQNCRKPLKSHLDFSHPAMASRSFTTLSIFSCMFFLLTISSASRVLQSDSQKVSLGLYYESLCPYSANFIINYLVKIFEDGLIDIVDLNLVPFGNAKIRGNDTIACQHGPSECLLNTIEACAINVWPDLKEHFPFIYCVESLVYEHKYPQWTECFDKLGLDSKPIFDCYISGYGKELELQYAAETNSLQPPHKYVPWVVVDGEPLYEDYENFTSYVCKAYKGTAVPEVCSELSLKGVPKEKQIPINPVCYTEKPAEATLSTRIGPAITSWMHWPSM